MVSWSHAWPALVASFLASVVEFVEALTVILAVGTVRGWRGAFLGASTAIVTLCVIVLALGPALTHIPLGYVQVAVGTLLLLFGMRWLRKAMLRSVGVVPLHDEAAAYDKETESLRRAGQSHGGWDGVAISTAFKITMLEGLEVVFIVIAIGAGGIGLLLPAIAGALAALILVILLGLIIHRPLASVPENTLKFIVGVLLTAFGTFWIGEGIGAPWPGQDLSILGLTAGFLIIACGTVFWCRTRTGASTYIAD